MLDIKTPEPDKILEAGHFVIGDFLIPKDPAQRMAKQRCVAYGWEQALGKVLNQDNYDKWNENK